MEQMKQRRACGSFLHRWVQCARRVLTGSLLQHVHEHSGEARLLAFGRGYCAPLPETICFAATNISSLLLE